MKLWDHKTKEYIGHFDLKRMDKTIRRAYYVWHRQKREMGVEYTSKKFMYWWFHNPARVKMSYPNVGRKDHSKKYSFSNIFFQEQIENIQERNERLGNPGKTHRPCEAVFSDGRILKFKTKTAAAKRLKVSEKTIYNHCQKRTAKPFFYGPNPQRKFYFRWA